MADDADYQRYTRALNAAIFLRIKSLYERAVDLSPANHLKSPDQTVYNETLVHLTHYVDVSSRPCLGFEHFLEKNVSFKQWFAAASNTEHYPYLIFGGRASGKTLVCTKLVQYLVGALGKTSQCIVRYAHLTSKSRHIAELFSSICAQMSHLQSAPANDQHSNRIEYFQSAIATLARDQKPLILMIDGVEDIMVQNQQGSAMAFYQTLFRLLPAKVGSSR